MVRRLILASATDTVFTMSLPTMTSKSLGISPKRISFSSFFLSFFLSFSFLLNDVQVSENEQNWRGLERRDFHVIISKETKDYL